MYRNHGTFAKDTLLEHDPESHQTYSMDICTKPTTARPWASLLTIAQSWGRFWGGILRMTMFYHCDKIPQQLEVLWET